jgi:hypothetical protein
MIETPGTAPLPAMPNRRKQVGSGRGMLGKYFDPEQVLRERGAA